YARHAPEATQWCMRATTSAMTRRPTSDGGGRDPLPTLAFGLVAESGLRVAVVGCGYWGAKHVRVLHSVDGVDGVVLVDGRTVRLTSLARSYPADRCFGALRDALPYVDAVVVATPPSTHVPVALEAIDAGKHVLVEKPLAPTVAGAHRLIEAAGRAGVVLMVG